MKRLARKIPDGFGSIEHVTVRGHEYTVKKVSNWVLCKQFFPVYKPVLRIRDVHPGSEFFPSRIADLH
jgi:hypothetical protein